MPVANQGLPPVVEQLPDEKEHRRRLAVTLNHVLRGRMNATTDVTLSSGASVTVLQDARLGAYSAICPAMAMTAHATAAINQIYVDGYLPAVGKTPPQVTIHHLNDGNADKKIRFLIIG